MAFAFPIDSNNKAGAVKATRGGNDFVVPVASIAGLATLLTSAALAASAAYTQAQQDRFGDVLVSRVRGFALTDQAGTLYVEESNDATTWTAAATLAAVANQLVDTGFVALAKRYYRFRYTNGATLQTLFLLYQSIASAADIMEQKGWTWQKVVAAAPGDMTVKAAPGKVAKLHVETATVVVYIKDGTSQAWASVTGANGQDFPNPLSCVTDIKLNFSAAGTAWILSL